MNRQEIEDLAHHAAAAGLTIVELETGETRLVLRLTDPATDGLPLAPMLDHTWQIVSPASGRFTVRHPARAVLDVEAGARVEAGVIVAYLVAGALVIPVAAPASGVIAATLVEEGALVGFGDPLFSFVVKEDPA